jgi:hypothetical protein
MIKQLGITCLLSTQLLLMLVLNSDINTRCVNGKEVAVIVVFVAVIFIVIIIIITCHELGLDRPVVASSISLFKGLLHHICPFGL